MQDIFLKEAICIRTVRSGKWKLRQKNRDEYQSKDAETDLSDSDGRKLGISQTHMSNVEVGRAMFSLESRLKNILAARSTNCFCLKMKQTQEKESQVIRYLD